MKLVFDDKSPWPVVELPPELPTKVPTQADPTKDPIVLVRPFEPMLNFWGPWKDRMLRWGIPPGGSVDIVSSTKAKTKVEWPVEIVDWLVQDTTGKVVETRVTFLYFFLEWSCMAVVCGSPEKIAATREQAIALLSSARPDWSGAGIPAISMLYA